MKKYIICGLMLSIVFGLVGCGENGTSEESTPSVVPSSVSSSVSLDSLKQGDKVSITGQVASGGLVNGDTLWVQVQQNDGSFVIYHCQLKEEFIEKASDLKMLKVVSVKGLFASRFEVNQSNTSPLVTLYDCEIL